jgi:hypothetical protein
LSTLKKIILILLSFFDKSYLNWIILLDSFLEITANMDNPMALEMINRLLEDA